MHLLKSYWWVLLLMITVVILSIVLVPAEINNEKKPIPGINGYKWKAPDILKVPADAEGDLIRYGRNLIVHTSFYLGPKGTVATISNGMNCQNCHLAAGTKYQGNNYSAVNSTYPKFRARSGTIETLYKRINDCIERSLNGKALDTASREMQAIYAYINWLGKNVPKGTKPVGTGIEDLPFLNRPADPEHGQKIYTNKCQRCHATNGEGVLNVDRVSYQYPPLWGEHSYNTGAGLYRLSRLAGYIKYNMPFDFAERKEITQLTDDEAWDVAAFINAQPRPKKAFNTDWPDIATKPFDHPYGPYADSFPEHQHKYGPFQPIIFHNKNIVKK